MMPTAAYIHIPFCRRRCYYCDFPISVVGDVPPTRRLSTALHTTNPQGDRPSGIESSSQTPSKTLMTTLAPSTDGHGSGAIAHYLDWLQQEITVTVASMAEARPLLDTVFFGGGTPSLLSVAQLQRILDCLQQQIGIHPDAEISIEMDPGTFSLQQIQGYAQIGINRVSLGAQAFQRHILDACGRTHSPADIFQAVDWLHQAGITNFSLDLISGLPHQSMKEWQESLAAAIALQPTHISVYDLTIEPMTAFGRWYRPGGQPLPTDEETAQMYRQAQVVLTQAGYRHYEISNYALPGFQCRHNRVYWTNQPHYGFGLGATSYIHDVRYSRPRTQVDYRQWVETLTGNPDLLEANLEANPTLSEEILLDTLMVGLRLAEGIDLAALRQRFGDRVVDQLVAQLRPHRDRGWIEFHGAPLHESLRLTDPEGFLFSNVVLSDLFSLFQK